MRIGPHMRAVRRLAFLSALLCLQVLPHQTSLAAQSEEELRWIVDVFMRLCVVGGENVSVRASGTGETDLALRSLDAQGQLQGEFHLQRSRVEGLINGIDNSITALAAQQVTEARRCLEPLRVRLLTILLIDRGPPGTTAQSPIPVAPRRRPSSRLRPPRWPRDRPHRSRTRYRLPGWRSSRYGRCARTPSLSCTVREGSIRIRAGSTALRPRCRWTTSSAHSRRCTISTRSTRSRGGYPREAFAATAG